MCGSIWGTEEGKWSPRGWLASRPMTDEMRERDVRGGACVLFGRVAEPTFKQAFKPGQNATKSRNEAKATTMNSSGC